VGLRFYLDILGTRKSSFPYRESKRNCLPRTCTRHNAGSSTRLQLRSIAYTYYRFIVNTLGYSVQLNKIKMHSFYPISNVGLWFEISSSSLAQRSVDLCSTIYSGTLTCNNAYVWESMEILIRLTDRRLCFYISLYRLHTLQRAPFNSLPKEQRSCHTDVITSLSVAWQPTRFHLSFNRVHVIKQKVVGQNMSLIDNHFHALTRFSISGHMTYLERGNSFSIFLLYFLKLHSHHPQRRSKHLNSGIHHEI
jgi:hypothetical protein